MTERTRKRVERINIEYYELTKRLLPEKAIDLIANREDKAVDTIRQMIHNKNYSNPSEEQKALTALNLRAFRKNSVGVKKNSTHENNTGGNDAQMRTYDE
jgi:hypothetical protein